MADMQTNGPTRLTSDPLPVIRKTVRELLLSCPAYNLLSQPARKELAQAMVKVSQTAAMLILEEIDSSNEVQEARPQTRRVPTPLAVAQSAGSEFSGVAASRVAGTTQAILNAVSFPRFVTDLINGVFKAMTDSNAQQMNSYIDLLNAVAASTEGFADANYAPAQSRQWLVERFPGSFEMDELDPDADPEERQEQRIRLRSGASMPSEAALRAALNLSEGDSVPSGNPEQLVPLVRGNLAKTRQQMLSSMVLLGMQRIVIESGRITAGMRFHIDTRSTAQADQGSSFDTRTNLAAAGSYGVGPWGVSASMSSTIGYVSTQKSTTTEEMNTDLELNSSVEINFKSDYVPLNRLASNDQAARIRENSRNPEAESAKAAEDARRERAKTAAASDEKRLGAIDKVITPTAPSNPKPGEAGTVEAAEKACKDAADKAAKEKKTTSSKDGKETTKQDAGDKKDSATKESSGKKESTTKESPAKTTNKTEKPASKKVATASP
jgi:hypothetical protein